MPQRSFISETIRPSRTWTGPELAMYISTGGVNLEETNGAAPSWTFPSAAELGGELAALLSAEYTVPPDGTVFTFQIVSTDRAVEFLIGAGGTLFFFDMDDDETLQVTLMWTGASSYSMWSTSTEYVAP